MMEAGYENCSDEELIRQIRNGHAELTDLLLERYKNEVRRRSNGLKLMGADEEDLIQEGMIGLFRAVREYKADRSCSFATFASRSIRGAMVNAVLHYQSKKYGPLNFSLSFSGTPGEEETGDYSLLIGDSKALDPEKITLDEERVTELTMAIKESLSKRENQVFEYCLKGLSGAEIAEKMDCNRKSVENTMNRIKTKIQKIMNQNGDNDEQK